MKSIEKDFGVHTAYSSADMSKPAEIVEMVHAAQQSFGKVDVLVNNAGVQHVEPVETFPIDKWDAIIAINLSAAFHAIRSVVPEMKKRKWGRIINVASAHALVASPSNPPMSLPSMEFLGSPKWWRSKRPSTGSPSTRSVLATC